VTQQHNLPLLGGIAGVLRWLEELAVIASGPLLVFGLGIALVALLTDGQLLVQQPWLLYAWAVAQAVGCDALLLGSSFNVGQALRSRRFLVAAAYTVLVCALAYVGYVAALVFATQESAGVSTATALGSLGLDRTTWIVQRSALSVGLVVLSGLLRYVQPTKVEASLEDEREKLARELTLEPLRQQARALKSTGYAQLARNTLASLRGSDPPTGPGTPVLQRPVTQAETTAIGTTDGATPTRLHAVSTPRKRRSTARGSNTRNRSTGVERAVRAVWQPDMSVSALASAAGIGRSTASKWRKVLLAEAQEIAV